MFRGSGSKHGVSIGKSPHFLKPEKLFIYGHHQIVGYMDATAAVLPLTVKIKHIFTICLFMDNLVLGWTVGQRKRFNTLFPPPPTKSNFEPMMVLAALWTSAKHIEFRMCPK